MGRVFILDGMWNKSLAAVRTFGRRGFRVTCGEKTRLATSLFSRYCHRRVVYPSPTTRPEDFLEALEKELTTASRKGAYDLLLPMEFSTQVLLTNPASRKRLEQYTRIPFADAGLAIKLNDKGFVMRYAKEMGIEIPPTYSLNDRFDLENSILKKDQLERLRKIADKIEYPALIKPRVSSGTRGIVSVKSKPEFIPSYLGVHRKFPYPIIQEEIPQGGDNLGVGLLLNFQSEPRAAFVYRRLRSYPVQGGPSTLRESIKRDDVRQIAEALLKSLHWIGCAHVEFKVDPRDGRPKLLEINPRFWGSLQLAIASGVDFPYLLYRLAMDGDVEPVHEYRAGVMCRWLIPGDIMHFLKNPDRFRLEPGFFNFKIKDDILSLTDPMPTMGRILSGLTFLYDREMRELIGR